MKTFSKGPLSQTAINHTTNHTFKRPYILLRLPGMCDPGWQVHPRPLPPAPSQGLLPKHETLLSIMPWLQLCNHHHRVTKSELTI